MHPQYRLGDLIIKYIIEHLEIAKWEILATNHEIPVILIWVLNLEFKPLTQDKFELIQVNRLFQPKLSSTVKKLPLNKCLQMPRNYSNAYKIKCKVKIVNQSMRSTWDVLLGLETLMDFLIMSLKILQRKTLKLKREEKFLEFQMM